MRLRAFAEHRGRVSLWPELCEYSRAYFIRLPSRSPGRRRIASAELSGLTTSD